MKLESLLAGILDVPRAADQIDISYVTADSRYVVPGALFAALQGSRADGARFVPDAIAAGAAAILERVGTLFGRLYANLVYYCQPKQIVVTGGLTPRFPAIKEVVKKTMMENNWLLAGGFTHCEPVMSSLEDTAGVIGAAAQARAKAEESP